MPHDTPLIWMIVAGFGFAFILGALANRLRMPPLVGYLLAGVLVGPFTPGFVADTELAGQLSEIGVILLMFGVGLHFSLKDLMSVQAVAVPGAIVLMAGGTGMGMLMGIPLGWPIGGGLVFGLALSVASTVVLLKALQDRHLVESERGKIAVGWVIVEDIAMVLALVLIPTFAGVMGGTAQEVHDPFVDLIERLSGLHLNIWAVLGVIGVKLLAFLGFMLVVGRRVIPWVLHMTAHTGSRELFRLAVLAIALGVAAGSAYVFGVSLALGAFFAGMILSESELSNRAAQESLPFRDAFAVLFFVSVGMLFNPAILVTDPLQIIGTLFIILVGKTALGFVLVLAIRKTPGAALTIAVSLAQIGEFSFILAALGVSLGLLPLEAQSYILAGAIISIILNPLLMYAAEQLRPVMEARFGGAPAIVLPQRVEPDLERAGAAPAAAAADDAEPHPTRLDDHVVLIGYGRVGKVIAEGLAADNKNFVLIEDAENRLITARARGIEVIAGNAASGRALGLANVAGARCMIIAIPNAFEAGQVVEQARRVNAGLRIIARAHSDDEEVYLRELGANAVIMGEREIGLGMLDWVAHGAPASAASPHDPVTAALATAPAVPASAMPETPAVIVPTPEDIAVPAPDAVVAAEDTPAAPESLPELALAALHGDTATPDPEAATAPAGTVVGAGELVPFFPPEAAIVEVDVTPPEDAAPQPSGAPLADLERAMAAALAAPVPEPVPAAGPAVAPSPSPSRPGGPSNTPGQPYIVRPTTPEDVAG